MTLPADETSEHTASATDAAPEAAKVEKTKAKAAKNGAAKVEADKVQAAGPDAVEPDAGASKPEALKAGKALAPAGASPVNPFVASAAAGAEAEAAAAVPPRPFMSRMLDYSAHAAIIVGLIGFAWTVSDHVVSKPGPKSDAALPVAAAALPEKPMDDMAQLRLANQKLHDEIKALKTSVDTLRATVRHDTTPEQVRMLSAGIDSMKGTISAANTAIAQLNGKVDKLQPAKIQQLAERVGRLEHQTLDPASTGSIAKGESHPQVAADPAKTAPKPPSKPASLASNEDMPAKDGEAGDKPTVLSGWVVRDVYQGVALIEGKRGTMEIVPGVAIPGAGVVKSIDRKGNGWMVTTTKGQFASAAPSSQAHNEHGRGNGYDDGYGPYGHRGGNPYRYGY